MKSFLATVLLNLGWHKLAGQSDVLVAEAEEKEKVNAAVPSCSPTI